MHMLKDLPERNTLLPGSQQQTNHHHHILFGKAGYVMAAIADVDLL